jgi:glycine cleavage system H protein
MSNPPNLKYTKDHEWARAEGKSAVVVGITHHAQDSLGDVVYVELPKVGAQLTSGQPFGVVESTKAVSELFSPVSGKVVKVNDALVQAPQTINQDPYGKGWMAEIEMSEPKQLDALLDAAAYEKLLSET